MKNCYFEQSDLFFSIYLKYIGLSDSKKGFHITAGVPRRYISPLKKLGVYPKLVNGEYVINVKLNMNTSITKNGKKIEYYDSKTLNKNRIRIRKLVLKPYSESMQRTYDCECYAKELLLTNK